MKNAISSSVGQWTTMEEVEEMELLYRAIIFQYFRQEKNWYLILPGLQGAKKKKKKNECRDAEATWF